MVRQGVLCGFLFAISFSTAQVAVAVYAANKTNAVSSMIARGMPPRLAVFISLPFVVALLDYITMPLCSLLLDAWLSKPRFQVRCAASRWLGPWAATVVVAAVHL